MKQAQAPDDGTIETVAAAIRTPGHGRRPRTHKPGRPSRVDPRISEAVVSDLGQRFAPGTHLLSSQPANLDRLLIGFLKDALATLNGISRCQELPINTRQRAAEVVVGVTQDLLAAMRNLPGKPLKTAGWNVAVTAVPPSAPAEPVRTAEPDSREAEAEEVPANWYADADQEAQDVDSDGEGDSDGGEDTGSHTTEDREVAEMAAVRQRCAGLVTRYLQKHGPVLYRELKNAIRGDNWKLYDRPKAVFDDLINKGVICRVAAQPGEHTPLLFYLPGQDPDQNGKGSHS